MNGAKNPPLPTLVAVDLRSDTVTQPSSRMREAMSMAEVGDDVFGEDPTVNELERLGAETLGKEAALFVPSGTMGNLISVMVWCEVRGSEVLLGSAAHITIYEQGGVATLGGIHPRTIPNLADGTLDLGVLEAAIRPLDQHFPTTRLICLEQTHNRCGGKVLPLDYCESAAALAKRHGLALHCDGARLFNASAALGVPVARLAAPFDSLSVCLSKGLGAPVGSLIAGPAAFVAKCRRLRKALGGGMRQAGVLAAAGLIALTQSPPLLALDHARARALASGLRSIPGVSCPEPETNIVFVELDSAAAAPIVAELGRRGVRVLVLGEKRVRLVTHLGVTDGDVSAAVGCFRAVAALDPATLPPSGARLY